MVAQYGASWIIAGVSVLSAVFGAGGFLVGISTKNASLDKKIDHVDDVKQSKVVCAERHATVDVALYAINQSLTEIKADIRWIRERNGGGK